MNSPGALNVNSKLSTLQVNFGRTRLIKLPMLDNRAAKVRLSLQIRTSVPNIKKVADILSWGVMTTPNLGLLSLAPSSSFLALTDPSYYSPPKFQFHVPA
jgi:hypothetical protein